MLTEQQRQVLRAAVDRIIPTDDFPGGWDAGVGDYFTRLFAREPRFLPAYQNGLEALEAEARTTAGRRFADLDVGEQDVLLLRVEAGEIQAVWIEDSASFFRLLIEQTMEGFYADPGNGGNQNGVAWDMIGYRVTA